MVAGLLSCGGCAFFQVGSALFGDGLCRREPPGVYVYLELDEDVELDVEEDGDVEVDEGVGLWVERSYVGWPEVEIQDWCGSFVERGRFESSLRHPSTQKP